MAILTIDIVLDLTDEELAKKADEYNLYGFIEQNVKAMIEDTPLLGVYLKDVEVY